MTDEYNKNMILFWTNLRASLIQEANDLQKLRAAKLQQAETIKRMLDSETAKDKIEELNNVPRDV